MHAKVSRMRPDEGQFQCQVNSVICLASSVSTRLIRFHGGPLNLTSMVQKLTGSTHETFTCSRDATVGPEIEEVTKEMQEDAVEC